ncbi:het-s domain-containing protein [Fusarium coicis]|nr:het-s domain-containing protein [Fusarium coicis]
MALLNTHQQTIGNKLTEYRPLRTQRYAAVNVLIITWKDHDFGVDFDREVTEVKDMFSKNFNYAVWPFRIPSQDPELSLNVCVAQFIKNFGGADDLLIVFYSGHGGGESNTQARSPCIWAAKISGGPTLDWSNIQPQLFLSLGDVAIILDCCYAGQAARPHTSHKIEFLAATDKDNWTPTGMKKWPSFTKVLMREMNLAMSNEGLVTLAALQSRMVIAEAGLKRQPLLVSLSGNASEGPIKLTRLTNGDKASEFVPQTFSQSINSVYLRLCLFDPLDGSMLPSLLRWLTRDSPASVEDIQLIDCITSQAQDISKMGTYVCEAAYEQERTEALPFLSQEGRTEAQRLLAELKLAVLASGDAFSVRPGTSHAALEGLRAASSKLVDFLGDSLATMDTCTLSNLGDTGSTALEDIRSKIAMRLTLLDDEKVLGNPTRVSFSDTASLNQRIRHGTQAGRDVLVEYIYYLDEDPDACGRMSYQIKRIIALLTESKSPAFRCFEISGFTHETLFGPRFGLVHLIAERFKDRRWIPLAELIGQAKYVPLDRRMRLAEIICEAILHLHSIGWYHKNIKSQNIILFDLPEGVRSSSSANNWDFENPFLIGFDCSRPADAEIRNTVDFMTENNIYRHPERWGRSARFEKHHDIYALGILLLEIGSWLKIPTLDTKQNNFTHISNPEILRSLFLKVASSKLAHAAGTRYAEAVKVCIENRSWKTLEDWESQKLVRETVLYPLRECVAASG